MSLRHVDEGLLSNLLALPPVTLLCDALEKCTVEEGQEIGVRILRDCLQVCVDERHWLDQQFAIVGGIQDANDGIPHGLGRFQDQVCDSSLRGNVA